MLTGTNKALRKGFGEGFNQHAEIIGNQGLPMSEGEVWRRQRRIMQPGMYPKRIVGYTTTMVRHATELVDTWRSGGIRDVHQDMVRLTQRIAVRTLFGAELATADGDAIKRALEELNRFDEAEFNGLLGLLPARVPTPNRSRLRAASRRVEELIMAAVHRRREEDGSGISPREDDLLAMLLDARDDDGSPMDARLWSNAHEQGAAAARTLLAADTCDDPAPGYEHVPSFWSDLTTPHTRLRIRSEGHPGFAEAVEVLDRDPSRRAALLAYGRAGRLTGAVSLERPRHLGSLRGQIIRGAAFPGRIPAPRTTAVPPG